MSTDRELLELAAKAAGVAITPMEIANVEFPGDYCFIGFMTNTDGWPCVWFNPLTDDGDALRLAVKLNISINRPVQGDSVQHWGTYADDHTQKIQVKERDNGDPVAATRRAIVRAAAEIGKDMP